jgi:hypothetical protein
MPQLISDPILLMGGTGAIGGLTARALRTGYPDVPLLIGGRDLVKSRQVASEIGQAEGVVIDPRADDLGLGDRRVSAVAVFYADERLAGLRFAQGRRLPHLSISSGVYEIAPEVATYMHTPSAAAIVLGYEWLVGLDGSAPTPAGLYFPFQVLDHATYLSRLQAEGGSIVPLDVE